MTRFCALPLVATALFATLASTPAAEAQTAWEFSLQSNGQNVSWTSPTAIDTSYAGYTYTYELTTLEANIGFLGWQSLLSQIDAEDRLGGGALGSLPRVFINESVVDNEVTNSALTVVVGINSAGYGNASLSNITFGSVFGQNITGIRIGGTITVIPEPASLALLGMGGLMVLSRPRQRRA